MVLAHELQPMLSKNLLRRLLPARSTRMYWEGHGRKWRKRIEKWIRYATNHRFGDRYNYWVQSSWVLCYSKGLVRCKDGMQCRVSWGNCCWTTPTMRIGRIVIEPSIHSLSKSSGTFQVLHRTRPFSPDLRPMAMPIDRYAHWIQAQEYSHEFEPNLNLQYPLKWIDEWLLSNIPRIRI